MRRKTDGVVRFEKAKSLLAAEFVHTTSRLAQDQEAGGIPDPQLHSHLDPVRRRAQGRQARRGRIQAALPLRPRERRVVPTELAHNLARLGLQIERRTGDSERYFELEGVPQELAERWSSTHPRTSIAPPTSSASATGASHAPESSGRLPPATRGSKTSPPIDRRQRRVAGARRGARTEQPSAPRNCSTSERSAQPAQRRPRAASCSRRSPGNVDDHDTRTARQGLRAVRRRLPARRGRPADRRAGALRRAAPAGGRHLDDPPLCARWSRPRSTIAAAARQRERRPSQRAIAQAGAPRDRQGDPRLAHPRAARGAGDDHRPRRHHGARRPRRDRQGRRDLRRRQSVAAGRL